MNSLSRFTTAVIKIGTDVITNKETGFLDKKVVRNLVSQVAAIKKHIRNVLLVTSGAVASGRALCAEWGIPVPERKLEDPAQKQMYAKVGQRPLLNVYGDYLEAHGFLCDQTLLSKHNFLHLNQYRDLRAGIKRTMQHPQIVPVMNENDGVCTDELLFTDNDELAASVVTMTRADALVLLTSVPGVLRDIEDDSSALSVIKPGSTEWEEYVHGGASGNGRGGMGTKCRISSKVSKRGAQAHIANGKEEDILQRLLLDNERVGTTFLARPRILQ